MQPECLQAPQTTETENPSRHPHTLAQHGKHHCDESVPSHVLSSGDGDRGHLTGSSLSPSELLDAGRVNRSQEGVNSGGPSQSKPPVDRISEYENAAIGSPKRVEEFGFKVIPSRNDTADGVSIEDFPNEVLTHILSHLPPTALSSISLVSHRFHSLVTTPHAWRIAFSRYFLGPAALRGDGKESEDDDWEHTLLKRRAFCRLVALTSWRSEYILRTRLLRSLSRGKPVDYQLPGQHNSTRHSAASAAHAVVTYSSLLLYPTTHLDGAFGSSLQKKLPMFAHGASEQGIATSSEPSSGRTGIGGWGVSDPQMFNHFSDLFPGETQWGLGHGDFVGMPNVMDVSQQYGVVYGECCPQGRTYFLSSSEKRGRFLLDSVPNPQAQLGIPILHTLTMGVCSVWIAKSPEILKMTGGLCGIMSGSSSGILTAYTLGPNSAYDQRLERGQVTARWVLSPGVPIIAIKVDEKYSSRRYAQRRIWATVLNALGEVFYLTDVPCLREINPKLGAEELGKLAWETGRSVRWELIENTRRISQPDPFNNLLVDGSYSPRSSSASMGLNENQIAAETKEIEKYLTFKPKHFRKVCSGWNMKRKLEVDFAGDDTHGAGESIVIIDRGSGEGQSPNIRRFTRIKLSEGQPLSDQESFPQLQGPASKSSVFGGSVIEEAGYSGNLPSPASSNFNETQRWSTKIEWRRSDFVLDEPKNSHITTSAIDTSTFALLTMFEDPLLGMCGGSSVSSQTSSPLSVASTPSLPVDIPGQRGRFVAIGTSLGSVIIWDIRAAVSQNAEIANKIFPVRIIHTDSPQISSLALTSLYLVHGGNDGLVQAWDPLASSMQPIRTLNSRFSSRARRRLMQAEATTQGVGHNYYAAGAICLDPDPTRLRGVVALGTQLRYWAYSSSAADQYKSSKRRIRYGQRGSNSSAENQRFSHTGRGSLNDYIMNEKLEVERQRKEQEKKRALLSGRFGVDLLGTDASEEDLLAYACMLSEEASTSDEKNQQGCVSSTSASSSSETIAPDDNPAPSHEPEPSAPILDTVDEDLEPDLAEAIRRSLHEEEESMAENGVIGHASPRKQNGSPPDAAAESSTRQEVDDLEFAIQLSLAEKHSETETAFSEPEEFPALASAPSTPSRHRGKGKGRAS